MLLERERERTRSNACRRPHATATAALCSVVFGGSELDRASVAKNDQVASEDVSRGS